MPRLLFSQHPPSVGSHSSSCHFQLVLRLNGRGSINKVNNARDYFREGERGLSFQAGTKVGKWTDLSHILTTSRRPTHTSYIFLLNSITISPHDDLGCHLKNWNFCNSPITREREWDLYRIFRNRVENCLTTCF